MRRQMVTTMYNKSCYLNNCWKLCLGCNQQQLSGPVNYRDFEKQASGSSLAVMLFPYTRNVFVCWDSKCSKYGTTCKCCDMWVWTLERCELFVDWFCFSIHVNSKDECAHDQIFELPIRVTAPGTRQRSKWQLPLLMRNYCNSVSFVLFVWL